MRRLGRRVLAVIVLLAVYLLTIGSVAVGDIAIGLVLAGAVELAWRRRMARGEAVGRVHRPASSPPVPLRWALVGLPVLIFQTLVVITRGTWIVSQYSLGFRSPDHAGTVEIEVEGVSEAGVAAWAFISTISPGEVVVDFDLDNDILIIHALDASDPDGIRAQHREFYERYQKRVLP